MTDQATAVGILLNMAKLEEDQAAAASVEAAATVEGLKEAGLWSDVKSFAAAQTLKEAAEVVGGFEEGTAAGRGVRAPSSADGQRWAGGETSADRIRTDPIGTGGDAMAGDVYTKVGENYVPLPGQVIPESSETGHEEAWIHNIKDMVDDWSTQRAGQARAYSNLRTRPFHEFDSFKTKMEQEYLDERADSRDLRRQLNTVFNAALWLGLERAGHKTDVTAQQMAWDSQRVIEDAVESGVASATQTQGQAQSAMASGLANQAWTQSAIEAAIASGIANSAQTQGNISAVIAADVAETLRESIVAMGTALGGQIATMGDVIAAKLIEALKE